MTGPANCKKTNFYKNPALSLFYLYSCPASCEKSEKSLEPFLRKLCLGSFGDVFTNISKSRIFFKNPAVTFLPLKPLTSCKKSEKFLEPFLRKLGHQQTNQPNIEVSDFALIWRRFPKYLQIKIFIKNLALSLFYLYSPLTYCTKSEKSFEPFLRKLHYQPINYYQQHQSYRISLMPVQQHQSHRTSLMPVQKSEFLLLIF